MAKQSLKILKINIKWLLAGIILVLLGFIILSIDPTNTSYEKTVFTWYKMNLAPVFIIAGYISTGISIFKTNKQ